MSLEFEDDSTAPPVPSWLPMLLVCTVTMTTGVNRFW